MVGFSMNSTYVRTTDWAAVCASPSPLFTVLGADYSAVVGVPMGYFNHQAPVSQSGSANSRKEFLLATR
jgi:hypothetical protein